MHLETMVQLTCTMIQLANVSQTVGGPLATANTLVVLATMHPRVYGKIWGGTLLSAVVVQLASFGMCGASLQIKHQSSSFSLSKTSPVPHPILACL